MSVWTYEANTDRDGKVHSETWTMYAGLLQIVLVRGHIYYPDSIIMHCAPWYSAYDMRTNDVDDAKFRAEELVKSIIIGIYEALGLRH